ncbi:MAG: chromosomal replication initiator protein DnaA [Paludibacteraceae bacterium]|nr:chromosomal replication initiator protein DnaA [Paludibacteraceae bacterium]
MAQNVNILWLKCAEILRDNLKPSEYNTWFASVEAIELNDHCLVLRVRSQFVAEYIEENYINLLSKTIRRVFGNETTLEYRVLIDSTSGATSAFPSDGETQASYNALMMGPQPLHNWDTQLNSNYTFQNFIQGETNKLARAAGVAIAKEPGKTVFNPLFVYGGSGVGKTHLANAIGNAIARQYAQQRVLYVNANTFKLQFQEARNQNKIPEFLLFYQSVDVLILDDIQFFSGLKGTQDTFFHIFNYLHQMGKQLILTSDRSPLQLKDVEDRLLTRFKWGLPVEIMRPDLALRKAILLDKMHRDDMHLSEEIVDYIAHNACDNIRDIEGILASLMAYSTLMNSEIDLNLTKQVVSRLVTTTAKQVQIEDVIGLVCEHTGISEKALSSKSRQHAILQARQMCFLLAKNLTDLSLAEIGSRFGHRSHATVLHALDVLNKQLEYDKVMKHELQLLEYELQQ